MSKLTVNTRTWIISDTHFGHKNIIKYCGRPKNHNRLMLANWKKLVKPTDTILHLGDVTVWYPDADAIRWAEVVNKLPGKKYLIMGNHDEQWSGYGWHRRCGFEVIKPFQQNKLYFSHEPIRETGTWEINIHGHSHNHAPFGFYTGLGCLYYNVSIEGMKYKPVRMSKILKDIVKGK